MFHRTRVTDDGSSVTGVDVGIVVRVALHQNVLFSVGRGLTHVEADRGSMFLAWQWEL